MIRTSLLRGFVALGLLLAPSLARAGEVEWRSWNAGIAEAAATGRPVLVDVYTEWCGWCKRMDRDVYSRADVREYLASHFVTIKLDAESSAPGKYEGRSLTSSGIAQRFRVSGYPTTVFLRANGEHLVNVPGYIPADRFKLMLTYIGEDHIGRGEKWSDFEKGATSNR